MKNGEIARLEAAYIKTWMHETTPIGECSWREDIADATAVCEKLRVPFRVVNLIGEYETHVVKMLIDGYARGITPNPDIACNRFIKFGAFLDFALKEGFTHVATGHYARVREKLFHPLTPSIVEGENNTGLRPATPPLRRESFSIADSDAQIRLENERTSPASAGWHNPAVGDQTSKSSTTSGVGVGVHGIQTAQMTYSLLEGLDPNKDQSYFLAQLSQEQLSHAIFPIGDLLKPDVRAIAKKFGLPNHAKKDSQGICFLGKVKINDFLRRYLPDRPGPIVNSQGREIGRHKGLHYYTIGQRHGMGIPSNADGEHYIVIAKDFASNILRVAFDHPATPGLYQTVFKLHHIHWVNPYNEIANGIPPPAPLPQQTREGEIDAGLRPAALSPTGGETLVAPNDLENQRTSPAAAGRYNTAVGDRTGVHGTKGWNILARPRYRDPKVPAALSFDGKNSATITFSIPQRALASGQLVAFHLGEELIGSGVYV